MRNRILIVTLALAAMCFSSCGGQKKAAKVSAPTEECVVLGFQYGTNIAAEEAKDITDIFIVNFHPAKIKVAEAERVNSELVNSGFQQVKMTKRQACEIGRRLGAKYVVVGSINMLMDEYSVDVQILDSVKETTVLFEGKAFPKPACSEEINVMARKIASKL